mmetsp:Transcript_22952/g.41192  ORF Transcript_22952/g.41192 Transcript_22952/m.41192 type:complete len:246 (+) Transcript_22952:529-1266(+)
MFPCLDNLAHADIECGDVELCGRSSTTFVGLGLVLLFGGLLRCLLSTFFGSRLLLFVGDPSPSRCSGRFVTCSFAFLFGRRGSSCRGNCRSSCGHHTLIFITIKEQGQWPRFGIQSFRNLDCRDFGEFRILGSHDHQLLQCCATLLQPPTRIDTRPSNAFQRFSRNFRHNGQVQIQISQCRCSTGHNEASRDEISIQLANQRRHIVRTPLANRRCHAHPRRNACHGQCRHGRSSRKRASRVTSQE